MDANSLKLCKNQGGLFGDKKFSVDDGMGVQYANVRPGVVEITFPEMGMTGQRLRAEYMCDGLWQAAENVIQRRKAYFSFAAFLRHLLIFINAQFYLGDDGHQNKRLLVYQIEEDADGYAAVALTGKSFIGATADEAEGNLRAGVGDGDCIFVRCDPGDLEW